MKIPNRVLYITGIYTIIQLIIFLGFGYTPYPDSQGYITCAQEALKFNQFYPAKETTYTLPFLWNVGAINAVALTLKLFHSITPLLIFYTLLKCGTCLLIYLITNKILNNKTAYIALLIYILYPANYGEGTSLLSEVPFVFLCLSGIYAYANQKHLRAGVLLGCADYFRPIAIIFIIAIILSNIRNYKAHFKVCLCYAMVISSIGLSNYLTKGEFIYKAKTGWMALAQYHWNNDKKHKDIEPMSVGMNHKLTYSQKDEVWKSMFFDWIKEHKMEYIKQIPIKIGKMYVSDNVNMCAFLTPKEKNSTYMYESLSMSNLMKSFPHYSFAQCLTVYNLVFYYALLLSFIFSFKYFKTLTLEWLVIIMGTIFIALFGHGEARFHIPYMPFIIICTAYCIYHHLSNKKTNEKDYFTHSTCLGNNIQ